MQFDEITQMHTRRYTRRLTRDSASALMVNLDENIGFFDDKLLQIENSFVTNSCQSVLFTMAYRLKVQTLNGQKY